jgi:integrase
MSATRSASIRVAHQRSCPNYTRTSLDSVGKASGCTCRAPSYFTAYRDSSGRTVKGPRVTDRQVADRALRKLQVAIDEERADVVRSEKVSFNEWAARYAAIIEQGTQRGATVRAYQSTLGYGRAVFGGVPLRLIGNAELRRFVARVREHGGDATVAKHLRQLGAVFSQAVEDGLLDTNPVPVFRRRLKLTVPKGTPPYTDAEVAQLVARLDATQSVYATIVKAAVVTGARIGELIALDWADVDLTARRLRIRRTWDPIDGAQLPKDGDERIVYLTAAAVALLERWTAERGVRADDEPVFPAPRSGGRLDQRYLHRLVDDALTAAGIAKAGEDGRPRKPLHSLRATFTRIMREAGVDPSFVQASLGHSTLDLSENVYGRWGAAAMRATADRVDAERFPV